jgi:hypothetical protein
MTDMATPTKNPLSIREIRKIKNDKRQLEVDKLRIYNITRLQTINIQMYGKTSRLVPYQQSIQIAPGRHVDIPTSRLMNEQITNLRRSGFIRTVKVNSKDQKIELKNDSDNKEALSNIPDKVKPNKLKNNKKS